MIKPLGRFFLLSLLAHFVFFQLSGLIFVAPGTSAPPPVRVRVIDPWPADNADLETGRIADLPEPAEPEKPLTARLLSRFDSRAKSPEKGAESKSKEVLIPQPAPPPQAEPEPGASASESSVTAKTDPDPFSTDVMPGKSKTEDSKRMEETGMTASPQNSARREQTRISSLPDLSAAEIDEYAASGGEEVIDLGDEAVVSLNTKAFEYIDYFASIKKAIELVWTYPEDAAASGASGRVVVRFSLNGSGALEDVSLIKSSGNKSLDDEARLAVKVAAPFEAFPGTLDKKRLHIVATFVYRPVYSAVR